MSGLADEIRRALQDENLQEALQALTQAIGFLRAQGLKSLPDYQGLRERARAIKEEAISNLDEYLEQFVAHVQARGGRVIFAKDGRAACNEIIQLAKEQGARLIVKSKSMTSEEIGLREALEAAGLSVVETDLGERIVQLAGERPSHLIGPAVHKTVDEVRRLFSRWLGEEPPEDPAFLTSLARRALRESFFRADLGITGVNFAVAETGTLVLVENEGNIRLSARLPKVHVALMGIEKLVPTLDDLIVFLKLLPRTATGQLLTSYISLLSPKEGLQLVILDGGRRSLRDDPDLIEALYCIRCGACLDSCPSYQAVGGHVYGKTYMGGIGCAWTASLDGLKEAAGFNELCTGCGRCTEVCPVKIDIPWLNVVIRSRLGPNLGRRLFGSFDRWARLGSLAPPLSNSILRAKPVRILMERYAGLDRRRALLHFRRRFSSKFARQVPKAKPKISQKIALFADCLSEHFEPEVLWAAAKVLEGLGFEVELARNGCCGRAALSQGLIEQARAKAEHNVKILSRLIEEGVNIVGVEPSCIAALRGDYRRLLKEGPLEEGVFEVMEYLAYLKSEGRLNWNRALKPAEGLKVVYHGHCQQKAMGTYPEIVKLLRGIPALEVEVVEVSCCGMAGSFGYKREFYELSRYLGRRLAQKIEGAGGEPAASGFSCRSQIGDELGVRVRHPIQILAELLGGGHGV